MRTKPLPTGPGRRSRRLQPFRKAFRPRLEVLETRLAPSADVLTFHNDLFRTGANLQEKVLTPANVNSTNFGKLFTYPVDGIVYAQPLYKSNVSLGKGPDHNVVFVATEHDSVYAFDADNPDKKSGGGLLWHDSFIDPEHGITTVPQPDIGSGDIVPEIGITGTPVIDPVTQTLYVVAKTKEITPSGAAYRQRLHALDITTGAEKFGGPVLINASVPGTGAGSVDGFVPFDARREHQRPSLVLSGGVVYITWASHGDIGPYHGWVIGYDAQTLHQVAVFNTTPNGGLGGIWMSAGAPAVDSEGNLYFSTGNGTADAVGTANRVNYGESIVKLSPNNGLSVSSFFTAFNFAELNAADRDLGSGAVLLLPDQPGKHPHLLLQAGKEGRIYLLDRDGLGGLSPNEPTEASNIVQETARGTIAGGSFDTPALFNDLIYYQGAGDVIKAFQLVSEGGSTMLAPNPVMRSNTVFGFTGSTPSVSANGSENALVWALQNNLHGTNGARNGPGVLHVYDARNLQNELYNSNQTGQRDQLGNAVKFTVPTVANGHVYVGSQFSVSVFGLLEDSGRPPDAAPADLAATADSSTQITLSWTNSATNATGIKIFRSLDGKNFTQLTTVGRAATSFTDTGLTPSITYFYQVVATNQEGDSAPSNTASAQTGIAAPVLRITGAAAGQISLAWTPTADDHYDIERSTDGKNFAVIGTVGSNVTSFDDNNNGKGLPDGVYFYRVRAFNAEGASSVSNTEQVRLGPVMIDHSGGFADHADLTANGSTSFTGTVARLTDGGTGQAGTFFSNERVGIVNFRSTFTFQISGARAADGFTFIIQGNSPTALGPTGGGLAYGPDAPNDPADPRGIRNSIAIKFDIFSNAGEGNNSTGLFTDGRSPTVRRNGLPPEVPDISINLNGTGITLNSGHAFQVDLTYDGATLEETIADLETTDSFMTSYAVAIHGQVGSDTAFVGFGGGTGGLTAVQDIQTWTFESTSGGRAPRTAAGPVPGAASILATFNRSPRLQSPLSLPVTSPVEKGVSARTLPLEGGNDGHLRSTVDDTRLTTARSSMQVKAVDQVFLSNVPDATEVRF